METLNIKKAKLCLNEKVENKQIIKIKKNYTWLNSIQKVHTSFSKFNQMVQLNHFIIRLKIMYYQCFTDVMMVQ